MNKIEKPPTHLKAYRLTVILIAAVFLVFVTFFSIVTGTIQFSAHEIISLLKGELQGSLANQVIFNVRMPRVFTGVFVGMNLAVAGVLLQGILRNPMASPNIIGVNAGAGLAAVIIMTILPGKIGMIPPASFFGALLAVLLIYMLSTTSGSSGTIYIILAGIAVSSLLSAVTSALMMINSDILEVTYSWLLGSLSGRSWTAVSTIWPYSLIALTAALFISPKVNLFGLGDEVASSVGLPIRLYRIIIMLTSAVLAGSAVSVAGTIGFVGLIAPHSARLLIGNDHRYLVPLSAILGAILLILSDTVARTIFQPVELSVGIITSVLGAPFFLLLLYRKGKEGRF
ncbi:FecCD family ABC transporter permease [Desulfoscipio sp. XC116]|uniref:FecCD family ABC transporter permease n=1 Tax=Desulfoscipio sp. XC116 TaxID=3144975 RepID=UPI00325AA30E